MALLTDQILASGLTSTDLIHVVITGDTSQNPAGSSFKATIQQVANAIGSPGFSGGTVPYNTYFSNSLSANTFSATTYLNLPNLSNLYLPLSGGTITGSTTQMVFNPNVNSSQLNVSGSTGLPMLQASIAPYLSSPSASIQLGIRTWNQVGNPGYGKVGDGFVYAGNETNGLNIINRQGTGTEDYVRIYAGQDANGTIPDIHVQGSGSTRGYVGFGTDTPTEKLDVNGNAIVQNDFTASTINISTTPTTDTSLSANYLTRDPSTGNIKVKQIPGPTVYGLFAQTGDSTVISATTVETSLINGGIGTLSVPANGFSPGDSFRADIAGVLDSANNETIRIRVKSGSVILLDSGAQTLPTTNNDVWGMSINFTVRKIGAAGVSSIVSLGAFHYTKTSNGNVEGFSFNTVNNTTFDTTVSNTLDITAQWGSTNANNAIYSDIFVLNKIF
jgi:hypothetical protein